MPGLFTIDSSYRDDVEDGFDDILNLFRKPCLLTYESSDIDCPNCIYDSQAKKSANKYSAGGPVPFTSGICPYCNGRGRIDSTDRTDTITMSINWGPTQFDKTAPANIRIPMGGIIETRGYIADYPKVKKCENMRITGAISGYGRYIFKLDGEPSDPFQFVQGKYFIANWKRVG